MAIITEERRSTTTATSYERPTTAAVTSSDGTTISYRQLGDGPGLVLLHGAMESSESHLQLAEALADSFTVYLPDRRGRGMSGMYGEDYSIAKEVADLDALLTATNTHNIFGVSAGAIIALRSALDLPAVWKAAIFEPPLIVNESLSTGFLARYDSEIAQGKIVSALVTGMLGAQMGPSIFKYVPRPLLEYLTKTMVSREDRSAAPDAVTMRKLAPTLHYEFQLAFEANDTLEGLKDVQADIMLLGGSRSPAYLKTALDALAKMLPNARRVEFPGLGHGATGNTNRGGKPVLVAKELLRFFEGT